MKAGQNMGLLVVFIFGGVFFLIFGLLNYYIGLRGWQYVFNYLPFVGKVEFWSIFWPVAFSYLIARIGRGFFPDSLLMAITLVGAYWLAAMFYFFQAIVIVDLLRGLNRVFHYLPDALSASPRFHLAMGTLTIVAVLGLIVYGSWNARNPAVTHYDITIPKKAGNLEKLHLVMVSDIHLGEIIHNGRLTRMVGMIKDQSPDLVLLPGDVVDEDIGPFVKQDMASSLRQLNPRYGVYAVPGNHEYLGGHLEEAVHYLEEAGIRELRDEYVKIGDSFYVVGREDTSHPQAVNGQKVKSLASVMKGINKDLPIILLNHQPRGLDEARSQGVDLQLSGHTHRGQLFPIQYITERMFEKDYGYLDKGGLQLIVSSGFGTWGPPIRIGNRPEIVDIAITFK